MKITARAQIPSRDFEVLEMKYEVECSDSKKLDEVHKLLTDRIKQDGKDMYHCLKGMKPGGEEDYVLRGGKVWRYQDDMWSYKEDNTWKIP